MHAARKQRHDLVFGKLADPLQQIGQLRRVSSPNLQLHDLRGQVGSRERAAVEKARRHFHTKSLSDPEQDLHRQQRVSTEFEEAVLHADAIDAQDLTQDVGDSLLGRRTRGHVLLCKLAPSPLPVVDFGVDLLGIRQLSGDRGQ